jgi:curved DNA-binding protein
MEFKDYYTIMGVERKATQDEIKRAYRKLARKYHPDVSKEKDAEVRFKELGEAYEVLKDTEKRAAYDQLGANYKGGQDFRPPPNWDSGFEFSGGAGNGGAGADFSDFFSSLFGKQFGGSASRQAKGDDHHAKILIALEDAYQGATRTITLHVPEVDAQGHVITKERMLSVAIPKGIREGQSIRLTGQGNAGSSGKAGDLYLQVEFQPHPLYRVDGRDIYIDLPLTPWEAALGATVKVPTLGGVVELKIPENSVAGRKMRLKGRGLPSKPEGDFYVILAIALPAANSDAAKDLYKKMAQELDFNPRAKMGV